MVHDRFMPEADLLLTVDIEPEFHQIMMSVAGVDPDEPDALLEWIDGAGANSDNSQILVATWSDDNDPVAVSVWRDRPQLDGWTHVHTAQLIVGSKGLLVGMTVSAVWHGIAAHQGPTVVEVWVRPEYQPREVNFVLMP